MGEEGGSTSWSNELGGEDTDRWSRELPHERLAKSTQTKGGGHTPGRVQTD